MFLTSYETLVKKEESGNMLNQLQKSSNAFFNSKISVWALIVTLTGFADYQVILAGSSLVMTEIYEIEIEKVGLLFGFALFFYLTFALFNRKKAATESPVKLLRIGVSLMVAAAFILIICATLGTPPFWLLWLGVIVFVSGLGMHLPNTMTIGIEPLPKIAGFASSIMGTAMILGAAFATFLASMIYNQTIFSFTIIIILSGITAWLSYFFGKKWLFDKESGARNQESE